jgi:cyclase
MRLTKVIAALALFHARALAEGPRPSSSPFVLRQIGPGVYAALDGPDHKAGSNAGFVIGDDGVLVIDSFISVDAARALVAAIRTITPEPIRYVVNTHYHLDHTGGDQALRDAGALIITHRNARAWLRTNNITLFGTKITPELEAQIRTLPLPDLVTDKDLTIWLGSRKVVVQSVLGHTGGDLTIYVPDAKVLFCGDLLWRKIPPNLIDGSVREWIATDEAFERYKDAAHLVYVPGHGEVSDIEDVEDFRTYLVDLRRLVTEGRNRGLKGQSLASGVEAELKLSHRNWSISDRAAQAEVHYMDEELAGTKRRPLAQPE